MWVLTQVSSMKTLLDLARNAQRLFAMQKPREKRRLLNFILSNCTWEDGEVVAHFRQPFDMLAETMTAAARFEAGEAAKSAKNEIWLTTQSLANRSPLIPPVFPCSFDKQGAFSGPSSVRMSRMLLIFRRLEPSLIDTETAIILGHVRDVFVPFQGKVRQ